MAVVVQDTSIVSTASRAITIAPGDELIVAEGTTVTTTGRSAVYGSGDAALDNHGFISALIGVNLLAVAAGSNSLANEGAIQASAGGTGVSVAGLHHISNTGSIAALGTGGIGAKTTGAGSLANAGSITAAIALVDADPHAADRVTVVNTGLVNGADRAFDGTRSAAAESIKNTGTMWGDVYLGNGAANTFDTRKGAISGAVHGGAGRDKILGSSAADHLFGGGGNDVLSGYDGNDVLDGGAGRDKLTGGAGEDVFVFDTTLGPTNVDTIADFNGYTDTVRLDHRVFAALHAGSLSASAFYIGAAAHDADDRIVYNAKSGALLYDADGTGAKAAVRFAVLHPHLHVTASDFDIV